MKNGSRGKRRNSSLFAKNTMLVTAVVSAVLLTGGLAGVSRAIEQDQFAQGVSISGMDISGMSYDQASKLVLSSADDTLAKIQLTVNYEGKKTVFDAGDLGISTNAQKILDEAFNYNKNKDDSLPDRFNKSAELSVGRDFDSEILIDESKLRNTVEQFVSAYNKPALDAQAVFVKESKTFTYTKGENGNDIDVGETVRIIEERIKAGDYSELTISGREVGPQITEDYLKKNTSLIGFCETRSTDDENRNTNISLMCKALDGYKLDPGQVLSINDLVGERTPEKGFKKAPAIMDGKKLTNEYGGGICQVSGTLYNAALLANMEIVERVHHTWPSSYLPVGLDSTLNWDDKDLKIKNTTECPIYISAKFEGLTVRIGIYGEPMPDGMTVDIENNILQKITPPSPDIIYTNVLPVGARQTQVSARPGYVVEVYRNYMKDGKVVDTELISKDNYPTIKGIILEGTDAQEK
jgi:vancomycin resistance protein YoaR